MNYNTVYVGMDVHKEKFTLCCYTNEKEQFLKNDVFSKDIPGKRFYIKKCAVKRGIS